MNIINNKFKLGILGGTFDPIHNGHLEIAEKARKLFKLNKILFIPVKKPSHKVYNMSISDYQRYHLIHLAIKSNPYFQVSLIEIKRGGISYTIDTVKEIKLKYFLNNPIYLIIGADLLINIHNWKDYNKLLTEIIVLVAFRNKISLKDYKNLSHIKFFNIVSNKYSSSLIKKRIKSKKNIKNLVPCNVFKYITENNLYK